MQSTQLEVDAARQLTETKKNAGAQDQEAGEMKIVN